MDSIFWFRRDLRLHDNAGLYHALKSGNKVIPIFIFDEEILSKLQDKTDKRVLFIHREISALKKQLNAIGSDLRVFYGKPVDIFSKLIKEESISTVCANRDYEPYANARDKEIGTLLSKHHITTQSYKDQCIFETGEVLKDDGKPYTVFTPYSKKWKAKMNDFYLSSYPNEKYFDGFKKSVVTPMPTLESMGFEDSDYVFPSKESDSNLITKYGEQRDIPSIAGTSRLGIHLRFGTVSVREKMREAFSLSDKFASELIWREFYMQILYFFPANVKGAFRPEFDKIAWNNNENEFKLWCDGQTGYPIVDAGMRELNTTGFMHNRVRMVVASFLTKHLLIDWRWGEAYFAEKLLDFDLSANNGGWQWAAGCGVDAAPYFRIFNPYLQAQKFDPQQFYIKKWVPEFGTSDYPAPIVDHVFARERCLSVFKEALKGE